MKSAPPVSAALWCSGRSLGDSRLSRTGNIVSFVTSVGDQTHLALRRVDSGTADQFEQWLPVEPSVKSAGSASGAVHDWLPDDSGVVYIGGDGRVHRFDFVNGQSRPVTRWPDAITGLRVSPDGALATFVIDMRNVAVVSLDDGESWPRRLSSGADFAFDPVWSPDGQWIAWHEWDAPNMPWDGGRIVVRRADSNGPIITVAGGDDTAVSQPRFSPNGHCLSFCSDVSGWMNVHVVDVPSFANERPIRSEPFEHTSPAWGAGQRSYAWMADSSGVVVARNEHGSGSLLRISIDGSQEQSLLADVTATGVDASADRAVALTAGPLTGLRLQVFSVGEEAISAVTPVSPVTLACGPLAGIERAGVQPENVSWTSDGVTVHGRLYRPPAALRTPPPMLVWIHGGPHAQSTTTLHARTNYFVERGWAVLVPDYRGSSGWGRAHLQGLRHAFGVVDVDDTTAGIRAAIDNGWADPDAIVAFGGSSAGLTALHILARTPELCAAGVVMYPLCDLTTFSQETWRFEAHYMDSLVGPLPENYERYVDRSPLTHAAKIRVPLLVLHGDQDHVVPLGQSERLVEAVRRAGGTVDFHVYNGEGHGWRKTATRVDELQRIEVFLRRYVLRGASQLGDET